MHIEDFFNKKIVFVEKMWLFELFFMDEGNCIDVWIIKITIKTNKIDIDVYFF